MKVTAFRPQDEADLRILRQALHLQTLDEALSLVERYIPASLLAPRMRYLLMGVFEEGENKEA